MYLKNRIITGDNHSVFLLFLGVLSVAELVCRFIGDIIWISASAKSNEHI